MISRSLDRGPIFIAGAYPAAPVGMDHSAEERFWRAILDADDVDGLEIPYVDGIHRDEDWFLSLLPHGSRHVVTAVPVTAMRAREDPRFGLASTDPEGRTAAINVAEEIRKAVRRLTDNGTTVEAVELQSAPSRAADPQAGSAAMLARSLDELAARDWCGAALVIEHCDAPRAGRSVQKGFLTLDDELLAVTDAVPAWGVAVNWARSVIEGRDPRTAVDHVGTAAKARRLRGVMFSGVADGGDGDWPDAHLPPAEGHSESLLTTDRMIDTLRACGDDSPVFLGAKVAARPADRDAGERADGVLCAVRQVRSAWTAK